MAASQSTGLRPCKHRFWVPPCWATGVSGVGAGNLYDDSALKGTGNGSLLGTFDQSASAPFGTLDAEITPETIDFFVSDAEGDPDSPSAGYSSIEQALNALRQGKVGFIVTLLIYIILLVGTIS